MTSTKKFDFANRTEESALSRRLFVAGLLSVPACANAAEISGRSEEPASQIVQDIGDMLIMGFSGHTIESDSANALAAHIAAGRAAGVCFIKGNVGTREEVLALTALLSAHAKIAPLIAIDHEGGNVQRLTARLGFTDLPSEQHVAATLSPDQARSLYAKAGAELAAAGFTVNLGPVVDLYYPDSPDIGARGRAFGDDPAQIVAYADAFIAGFASSGIRCALKHFPGTGSARSDSHLGPADLSATWTPKDLEPFRRIIANRRADIIMSSHFRVAALDPSLAPVTVSRAAITGVLRNQLEFSGIAMTDDLDMKSITETMDRREAVIGALAAGNDLLMIFNQENYDPDLPQTVVRWVEEAVRSGTLAAAAISQSATRVRRLRQRISAQRSRADP